MLRSLSSFRVPSIATTSRVSFIRSFSSGPLFTTKAIASGGRGGTVKSEDGVIKYKLELPKSLGGAGNVGANPESLFASGYAACFNGAFLLVARQQKIQLPEDTKINCIVSLTRNAQGALNLGVELQAHAPGVAKEEVQKLLEAAHAVCPYSLATKNNIQVKLTAL